MPCKPIFPITQRPHCSPGCERLHLLLSKSYGFTPEQVDVIVNYDIKYRMGQDGGEED